MATLALITSLPAPPSASSSPAEPTTFSIEASVSVPMSAPVAVPAERSITAAAVVAERSSVSVPAPPS